LVTADSLITTHTKTPFAFAFALPLCRQPGVFSSEVPLRLCGEAFDLKEQRRYTIKLLPCLTGAFFAYSSALLHQDFWRQIEK
jgi:hypothetical protein